MTKAYYNENDPFAAAWLRNLIAAGHIADGFVDERSIADVKVEDLDGFTQHHFFAGIGGWSYALRLAGWPDDKPVWTGSCPCQPFSAAGQRKGFGDDRHLWPEFMRLIRECLPHVVFGEQVASALGWLDLISGNLEDEDYAVGSAIVGAHSVGAPHIRQRVYWVADAPESRRQTARQHERGPSLQTARLAEYGDVEHASLEQAGLPGRAWEQGSASGIVGESAEGRCRLGRSGETLHNADSCGEIERPSDDGLMALPNGGDSSTEGLQRSGEHGLGTEDTGTRGMGVAESLSGQDGTPTRQGLGRLTGTSYWSDCDWLPCIDGKSRPVEPGTFPLAHGIPNRVGRLRGYGNAIVPQVAQAFIEAYMEAC